MISLSKVEADFLCHCIETLADTFKDNEEIHFADYDCQTILMNQNQIEDLYQKLQDLKFNHHG